MSTAYIRLTRARIAGASLILLFGTSAVHAGPDLRNAEAMVFQCYTCHGADGAGAGEIPGLRGKSEQQLLDKLMEFKRGEGNPTIMDRIAAGFSDEELARIARYLANLE
jgi:sulfide dehydrogenase cytochrome subunit